MYTWLVRVYFAHTWSDVQIRANSNSDARRLAEAQYSGHKLGNITRVD